MACQRRALLPTDIAQFSWKKLDIVQLCKTQMVRVWVAEPAWLWDSQPRMATMLRLEKSKRIEFTPGRGTTRGQNALKWMGVYAKGSGTLDGINFHSFFRLWRLVLLMSYSNLLQGILNMCRKCSFSWLLSLNNAIFYTSTAYWDTSLGQYLEATNDKTPTNSSHCLSACSSSTKYNII